jgi:hypothetical protein
MSLTARVLGTGFPQLEAWERRILGLLGHLFGAACLVVLIVLALPGCASAPVDVQPVQVPLVEKCEAPAVLKPTWALDTVQLTGNRDLDMVLIYRAMEAEIEQRIGYELALEAAVRICQ